MPAFLASPESPPSTATASSRRRRVAASCSAPGSPSRDHFDFSVADGTPPYLDRPDRLNVLTDVRRPADLLRAAADEVSVLVITGKGRGFCSGGDVVDIIGELLEMYARSLLDFTRMTGAVVEGIRQAPIPVIAAVNGVAAGAGAVIALASDFRVLARSARFHFLFTKVGLAGADMGSAYLLPRGYPRATELLMLGRGSMPTAPEIGLASQVVTTTPWPRRLGPAQRLAARPTFAYAATKAPHRRAGHEPVGALEMEAVT